MTGDERATVQYLRMIHQHAPVTAQELGRLTLHHYKTVTSWLDYHPELAYRTPLRPRRISLSNLGLALLKAYELHESSWASALISKRAVRRARKASA